MNNFPARKILLQTLLLLLLACLINRQYVVFRGFGRRCPNDSTVSVASFDIAGTLKQKVGVELPASAAPPPKEDLTSREILEDLAANSVGR